MKRVPPLHGGIFEDEAFALRYAQKHRAMGERLGRRFARELAGRGFARGRILDAGCGSGATLLILARRFPGCELIGIDLSKPLLALARKAAAEAGMEGRATFDLADVQQIPFPDASFDVVISAYMAHLVDRPVAMLNELERVLAPEGTLLMVDLRRSGLGWVEREVRSAFTAAEVRDLLARSKVRAGNFRAGLLSWSFESLAEPQRPALPLTPPAQ